MISIGIVYLLGSAVLFTVAVVVHFNASSLSLPFSPIISILAAILPIAGFLNAYIHPSLLYSVHQHPNPSRLRQLTPFILQTLQGLVATILATLLFESVIPSQGLSCILENAWKTKFRAHDGHAIRQIQDSLECCGFNSLKDRAYPWPKDGRPSTCANTYGRDQACREPWTRAMQTNAGVDLAVVLAVIFLQIFGLLMMREGTNWWASWRSRGWKQAMNQRSSTRPLLTGHVADGEDDDSGEGRRQGYGAVDEEEAEEVGPRVEPSGVHERNAWNEN